MQILLYDHKAQRKSFPYFDGREKDPARSPKLKTIFFLGLISAVEMSGYSAFKNFVGHREKDGLERAVL